MWQAVDDNARILLALASSTGNVERSTAGTWPVCGGIQVAADLLVVAVNAGSHSSPGAGVVGGGIGVRTGAAVGPLACVSHADVRDVRFGHVSGLILATTSALLLRQ